MSKREGGGSSTAVEDRAPEPAPARRRLTLRLLVVGAVVVVAAAIAVPEAFAGGGNAADSSAQSDLDNALASLQTLFVDGPGTFPTGPQIVVALNEAEPELTMTSLLVTYDGSPHSVSIAVSPDGEIVVVGDESSDQRCWYAEMNEESTATNNGFAKATSEQGPSYGATVQGVQVSGPGCGYTDAYLDTASFTGWGPSFPS